jgi:hypothetical protein
MDEKKQMICVIGRSGCMGFWLSFGMYASWATYSVLRHGTAWLQTDWTGNPVVVSAPMLWMTFTMLFIVYYGGARYFAGPPGDRAN